MLGMNIDRSLSSELKSMVVDCAERLHKETANSFSFKIKRTGTTRVELDRAG